MGIFDRLSTLFRSNINDLINRAENPEKMLNQLIVDMRSQLAKAKQQVAAAIADEKRLSAQVDTEKKSAEDWERRAVLAVQEGRDDLAKQALLRHNEHAQGAVQLHETWVKHRAETENLKLSLRQLNDRIEEAKRKKNILIARQKRAEAHKRIQETMSSIGDKSVFETFERMTEQIEHEERKLIAAAEVNEDLSGDTLVKQFQSLEVRADADQQLIELKRKMGLLRQRRPTNRSSWARERRKRSWSRMTTPPPSTPLNTEPSASSRLSGATFVALFVAALAIWFLIRVVEVLLLVFIAVLCAVYLSAITDVLERRFRLARWLGLTAAVLATLAALVGIGALLVPPVIDQTQALISGLPQTLTNIQNEIARWAREYPVLRSTELADPSSGLVARLIEDAARFLRGSILPYVTAGGKLFIEGASVVVMALYLARQPRLYRDGILSLVSPKHRPVAARILDDLGATLRAWVVGQLLAMMVLAILTALGLWVLGVPYWLAFGIFTGLVAVVPFFGTLVSTLLPALFVVGTGDWLRVLAVILLGVAVHVVEANVVVPRIMQRQVSLPPVLTIASVLTMGP